MIVGQNNLHGLWPHRSWRKGITIDQRHVVYFLSPHFALHVAEGRHLGRVMVVNKRAV